MRNRSFVVSVCLLGWLAAAVASRVGAAPQSDLDQFMSRVLAHRDENWKKLQQYVLDEREQVTLQGPDKAPIWGDRRDYTWFIRDGFFVRSPVSANGVAVSEADRRKYEDAYLRREQAREGRGGRRGGGPGGEAPSDLVPPDQPGDLGALISQTRQPGFIDSAYFLRFKFEAGKYALLGRETFDGREVLRIEYYPNRLFSREQDAQARRAAQAQTNTKKDVDATMERLMNKVSLVTLWVDQKDAQIVKYTFDNVNLDFLPAAWLVHVEDLKAVMTMSQPFKDVWLPRDIDIFASAMIAVGSFDLRYHRDYHDYREAKTSTRFRVVGNP